MSIEKLETPNEAASPFIYTINKFDVTHYIADRKPLPITLRFFELKAHVKANWVNPITKGQLDARATLTGGI